ncbi:alpha/beta fold hydrolase [Mangrovimonas cancribranchiae]|uniref:Alpha/beta hydrolase n=1 Tax=Mangrovimonas cancribranchiae TaxID=3080055 RepID=A0AAU6P2I4_9FLAO
MKKNIFFFLFMLPLIACSQTSNTMKNIVSDYEFTSHYITLDSIDISYVKEGNGSKTLLFVHGLSSNADAWSKNIKHLKKRYTCVALDLPGYGKSAKPNVAYTPTYFSKIIVAFIKQLDLKNVILVGHSMGGQASIKVAINKPDIIDKLILVAPAGIEEFSKEHGKFMKATFTPEFVAGTTNEQIKNNYALNFYKQPKEVDKMIADRIAIKKASDFDAHCRAISKSIAGMLDDPVVNDLGQISLKTLVLYGENDMLIPNRYFHPELNVVKIGETAKEKITHSTLVFVEESGHFLQFEQADSVNNLIEDFVENN